MDSLTLKEDNSLPSDDLMGKLPLRQQKVAEALLEGLNYPDAAVKANVSLASVKRWVCQSEFKAALNAGRRASFEAAILKLNRGFNLGLDTLMQLCEHSDSESIRRSAASDLVNLAVKVQGMDELNRRVEFLEATLYERN